MRRTNMLARAGAALAIHALVTACGSPETSTAATTQAAKKAPPPTPLQVPLDPMLVPQFVQELPTLKLNTGSDKLSDYPGGLHTIVAGEGQLVLKMCEFQSNILPPASLWRRPPATLAPTYVWGYVVVDSPDAACPTEPRDSYLGPVLAVARGTPTEIKFVNALGSASTTNVLAYKTGTDQTLHWADPLGGGENMCAHHAMMGQLPMHGCDANYAGPIPAVPHLHGGEVPPVLDGGPEAWFTGDGRKGRAYYTKPATDAAATSTELGNAVYRYPNTQEPGPFWFHDHTLGATRLNVYAGLAGAYYVTDNDTLAVTLPPVEDIVPLVLQDREFDVNGQLMMQAGMNGGMLWALNPEHPYWSPEFVGDPFDVIVVNGKAWPNLTVEPRRYRFLFINGSNARTYEMFLVNRQTNVVGPNMWVIATDGGFVDYPQLIDATGLNQKLVIMPGERYEVIVDFSGLAPQTQLFLKNVAKTPYPGGAAVRGTTAGQLMQFTVGPCTTGKCGAGDTSWDPLSGEAIRAAGREIPKLVDFATGTLGTGVEPTLVRQLTLNEVMGMPTTLSTSIYSDDFAPALTAPLTVAYPGGPLEILLNNTKWDAGSTETPEEGSTEVWEIVNFTADAHPIHLHLVQFQVLNRQSFDAAKYTSTYAMSFPASCTPQDPMILGYCPGFGPPMEYDPATRPTKVVPGAGTAPLQYVGGNPDVTPFLQAQPQPASPQERGWKDTVMAPPGMVTRLVVRWSPTSAPVGATGAAAAYPFSPASVGDSTYVWHCHIIDHEDNEMMRRSEVTPLADVPRDYVQSVDY